MSSDLAQFVTGVRRAEAALREIFEPTPLQRNDYLSAKHGGEVWLKREDLSPVRSYKIRGAANAMRKALAADPGQR
ncbi:threonine dehydratase, partial [Amaricoccus sp. HAR-UPW-R2A-40]